MRSTTRTTGSFSTETLQKIFWALQLIREKYWEYGYEEVVTPNLFNFELWKRSGHAEHYKDNMFLVDIEEQEFGLKPMNCPGAVPLGHAPFILPTAYSRTQGAYPCARARRALMLHARSWRAHNDLAAKN